MPDKFLSENSKRGSPDGRFSESTSEEGKRSSRPLPHLHDFHSVMLNRMGEKEQLQCLNNRLAVYIDHIHSELINADIHPEFDSVPNFVKSKLEDIENCYKLEIHYLHKSLRKISSELSDAKIQLKQKAVDLEDAINKINDSELKQVEAEKQIIVLNTQLRDIETELTKSAQCKTAYDHLLKQHEILKKQLENETLIQTDTKNQLLSVCEQIEFKDKLLSEERNLLKNEALRVCINTKTKLVEQFQEQISKKLSEIRVEMNSQMESTIHKLKEDYEKYLNQEKLRTTQLSDYLDEQIERNTKLKDLLDSRNKEFAENEAKLKFAYEHIDDLHHDLQNTRAEINKLSNQDRNQMEHLLNVLCEKYSDDVDLYNIKIKLDTEIALYRKLLESEESRLKLSPSTKLTGQPVVKRGLGKRVAVDGLQSARNAQKYRDISCVDRSTPIELIATTGTIVCESPVSRRAINIHDETSSHGGTPLRITCRADGPLHFTSADPGEQVIRIYNAHDKAVNIGTWHLYSGPTSPGALDYERVYTFPKVQLINSHSELQIIFSCASETSELTRGKRSRYTAGETLYLVTNTPVWNQFHSLIALQDTNNVVRATCEIEPLEDYSSFLPNETNSSVNDASRSQPTASSSETSGQPSCNNIYFTISRTLLNFMRPHSPDTCSLM